MVSSAGLREWLPRRRVLALGVVRGIRGSGHIVHSVRLVRTIRTLRGELVHSANNNQGKQPPAKGSGQTPAPSADVGDALRRAYDDTLNESVPDDLLDLLKKLD